MKLFKPSWVHHDDCHIFSVDIHPDGSRFATGGQIQESGRIVIWNMAPLLEQNKENDQNLPKFICQMDHHIGCVNIVRWSNSGLFLASGSDDKLVMIWQYAQGGSYQNIENWKCGHTLRGHAGDILDLAWSAKDQYLASCSVDNTIIVWNALKFPEICHRIDAHSGMVKGVCWDPIGIYLASQSDDKTLKIWKTSDWSLEKCFDEPFKKCCGTTHVLRLNWSPDGKLLVSAHAINNGAPTAQIIDRTNKWSTKLDFVGHRKAVTAVRFYPEILKDTKNGGEGGKLYTMCALGSRDCSISVWLTSGNRPLVAIKDLFDNPVMDLTWSKTPSPILLACSMDGTVACLQFSYDEIGYPISAKETEEFYKTKYNYDINQQMKERDLNLHKQQNLAAAASASNNVKAKSAAESIRFIENSDFLLEQEKHEQLKQMQQQKQLQQQQQQQSANENQTENRNNNVLRESMNNSLNKSNCSLSQQSQGESHIQIERVMANGRRRITPICVSKPGEYDAPKPFVFVKENSMRSFGSPGELTSRTATEQSTIIVEKRDVQGQIIEVSPVKSIGMRNMMTRNLHLNEATSSIGEFPVASASRLTNQVDQSATATITTTITTNTTKQNIDVTNNKSNNSSDSFKQQQQKAPATLKEEPPQNSIKLIKQSQTNIKINLSNKSETNKSTKNSTTIVNNEPSAASASTKQPSSISNASKSSTSEQTASKSNAKQSSNVAAQQNNKSSATNAVHHSDSDKLAKTSSSKQLVPDVDAASLSQKQQQQQQQPTVPLNNVESGSGVGVGSYFIRTTNLLEPVEIKVNPFMKIIQERGANNRSQIQVEVNNFIRISQQQTNLTNSGGDSSSLDQVHSVKFLVDSKFVWQTYLTRRIVECVGSRDITVCACDDSTLNFMKSSNGQLLCCPILLDSRVAILKCNSSYCMCISSMGNLYLWKFELNDATNKSKQIFSEQNMRTLISGKSCVPVMQERKFQKALLTEQGVPVVYLNDGRSFFYNIQTECWHLVPTLSNLVDGESRLLFSSSQSNNSDTTNAAAVDLASFDVQVPIGPLKIIQSQEKSVSRLKTITAMNSSTNPLFNRHDLTLNHLESQINATLALNSPNEYKFWLLTYARYLVEANYEEKLSELCDHLLGPLFSGKWNSMILSFKKHDLLEEILSSIMSKNLRFQRLYSYFRQQLNNVSGRQSSAMNRLLGDYQKQQPLVVLPEQQQQQQLMITDLSSAADRQQEDEEPMV